MIKKITLNEDHIRLVKALNFEAFEYPDSREGMTFKKFFSRLFSKKAVRGTRPYGEHFGWGIDQNSLFGGTFPMEDIALILGKYDQSIECGELTQAFGKRYPKELEDYWTELYDYIYKNLTYIISLVLFYCDKGGIKPGTYKTQAGTKEWERVEDNLPERYVNEEGVLVFNKK